MLGIGLFSLFHGSAFATGTHGEAHCENSDEYTVLYFHFRVLHIVMLKHYEPELRTTTKKIILRGVGVYCLSEKPGVFFIAFLFSL